MTDAEVRSKEKRSATLRQVSILHSFALTVMTSSILEVDPSLSEDTVLYRTLDFFGAAAIVRNKQLMFSRADTFSDKNEGIDRLLVQLEAAKPASGCGMGWHDGYTARTHHEQIKQSHFISCWSRNPESVAMWSLYSPDYCSVRVSTTISKLRRPIEELLEKYSISRLSERNLNQRVLVSSAGYIAPVEYASLQWIAQKITRRAKAHRRIAERYSRKGKSLPLFNDVDPRYYQREQQRRFSELRTTCRLKDKSFEHEDEVRLFVRLGEEVCSTSVLEDQAYLDPNHKYHLVLKEDLKAWGFVKLGKLPLREFAPCSEDLVETVAIDPRCPPHKADFMRRWFQNYGVRIVESACFGYLPDSFEVYPEW
ncbi:DUF2971 domain-containing protein [Rhodoferax sp. BLA1]|uniref:DUF2971 domain-containing protein n=1 Tax=Rhodoferax sp. BLA1 TaxID=2576062 RepID=UPI0015D27D0B|nr:DUF2971 domain-containing protein [Rhodoferax sp. BLA1]